MIRKKAAILLAAALTLSAAGCGTTGGKVNGGASVSIPVADEGSTDPGVAKAVKLYKDNCLVCHGPQLEGTKMSAKTNLKNVGSKLTTEEIHSIILKGGNGMISYKDRLSEDEIHALTDWLAAKK